MQSAVRQFRSATALLIASCLTLCCVSLGRAQPVSMAGQRFTIVVGSPAGGGYDAYGRLVGRHLSQFLLGNPGTVVQNMPGAGSLIAANWLANSAPKDGTVIATLPSAVPLESLLENSSAHFDARKMNYLSSLDYYTSVLAVSREAPFLTAKDLLTHEILVGASDANSGGAIMPKLLNSLLHTKFNVVSGYPGTTGIVLALERGEVQAMFNDWDVIKGTKPDWLRDNKVRILLQVTLSRNPELADVPTVLELADAENRDLLRLLVARQTYAGLFIAPPGVPLPVVTALREGFAKMVVDPDFKRDAQKSNLAIQAASADDVTATIGKLLASPQPIVDRAIAELKRLTPK